MRIQIVNIQTDENTWHVSDRGLDGEVQSGDGLGQFGAGENRNDVIRKNDLMLENQNTARTRLKWVYKRLKQARLVYLHPCWILGRA